MPDVPQDPISRLNTALEGRYRIEREIGEGGMATVYLADDLKHERKVALKVLKPELAAVVGAERFLAEIKTTANLQHPHILPLHDSGEADGFLFYVMPYVEGDTLRDKIDREKQLSVSESLEIVKKVASALDYAHEHGVVHRDIKPGNILLSERGEPTVADFGIALAVAQAGGGRVTETGLSVGTPHYMSPEQATGDRDVDPRTDIYALGCVLYEMLIGEPPYTGSTAQAILGKIIQGSAISATDARSTVSPNVDAAIRKALEKLPADRFVSAQGFAKALGDPGFRHGPEAELVGTGPRLRAWHVAAIAVMALLVGAAAAALWSGGADGDPTGIPARFRAEVPPEIVGRTNLLRVSPDGRYAVASTTDGLWLWPLASLNATFLPGTGGASNPFWSPDGRSIAFTDGGALRGVDLAGGPPSTIVASGVRATDGAIGDWSGEGVILFANAAGGISRVDASGGEPVALITAPDHFDLPTFLPDGVHFLYLDHMDGDPEAHGVYLGSIEVGPEAQARELIVPGDDGPVYVRDAGRDRGQILFWRDGTLLAQPFDERVLQPVGPATPLADGVAAGGGRGDFSASARGEVVMYTTRATPIENLLRVVWVDREGNEEPLPLPGGVYVTPRVSPDGSRFAAAVRRGVAGGFREDLWVFDTATGAGLQLTESSVGEQNWIPMWSPDGETIYFSSTKDAPAPVSFQGTIWYGNVYAVPGDGSTPPVRMMTTEQNQAIQGISPDGRTLVFTDVIDNATQWEIMTVPVDGSEEPVALVSGPSRRGTGTISPDGRWLAYRSDETGSWQIYVQPFPGPGARVPVSISGGIAPVWSFDGSELYYRRADGMMMAATIAGDEVPVVTDRTELFSTLPYLNSNSGNRDHHVGPDGRFLMVKLPGISTDPGETQGLVVLLNQVGEAVE